MGYVGEVIKWQFKRYTLTGIIVLLLIYLGYSSYYQMHFFADKLFLSQVVFEAVVMGFFGSLFFLAFLFSLKPNIKIADKICYNPDKDMYYFKMVNMSLFFSIKDVIISVKHCRIQEAVGDGNNVIADDVHLKNNSFSHVNSILGGLKNKVYAFIVQSNGTVLNDEDYETKDDKPCINDILNGMEHNYIELDVYARHSLSGFSVQKRKRFKNHHHKKDGQYATGINVDILDLNS